MQLYAMRGSVNITVSGGAAQFPLLGSASGLHNWKILRRTDLLPHPLCKGNAQMYSHGNHNTVCRGAGLYGGEP